MGAAAAVSLLPLLGAVFYWNRNGRIRAAIVGTGAAAVLLFWSAVAILLTIDQLNSSNAAPVELTLVGIAIFFGGALFAGVMIGVRIQYLFMSQSPETEPKDNECSRNSHVCSSTDS